MGDLVVYRGGGLSLIHGHGLYTVVSGRDHLHFTYPPFGALILAPLATVPVGYARVLVSAGSVLALYAVLSASTHRLGAESSAAPESTVLYLFAGAIWLEPVRATFAFGQIDLLLMALVVVDLLVVREQRWSGVLIGVAAAIKLTPLAFVIYLVVIGRRRQAARAVGAFIACAMIGFLADSSASRTYWFGHRFLSPHRIGRVENASNQSALGILTRALRTETVPWYWGLVAAVALVLLLALARAVCLAGSEVKALSVVAIGMLVASPVSWSHHWVWCVLLMVLVVDACRSERFRSGRVALGALVILPFFLGLVFWAPHTRHLELHDSVFQQLLSATYVLAGLLYASWAALELTGPAA